MIINWNKHIMQCKGLSSHYLKLLMACFIVMLLGTIKAQSFYASDGTASFTSSIPLYEFTGTSTYLTGKISLQDSRVDFYLDLETLDSGIKKRDKDMRLTLNTADYPFAEFYGFLQDTVELNHSSVQKVTAIGTFSIHGQKKELMVEGEITAQENGLRLRSEFDIVLDDYGITPPSLLIVKVDPIQKVAIDIFLIKE